MPQASQEEKENTDHKSIDELIEDAEIEAEIETEKKIRSKNTRVLTISLIAAALMAFIFLQMRSETTAPNGEKGVPLPELAAVPASSFGPQAPEQIVLPEPAPVKTSDNQTASEEKPVPEANVPVKTPVKTAVKTAESKVRESQARIDKLPVAAQSPPKAPTTVKKARAIVKPSTPASAEIKAPAKQYHVQLGVFSIKDNAKKFSGKIKAKGFKPSIQPKSVNMVRYIVYVGGFSSKKAGAAAVADLKTKGFDPVMEKLDQNSNTIVLGKFKNSAQAEAIRNKLSIHGYLSSAKKSRIQGNIHVVQIGPFTNLPQAQKTQKDIEGAGFNNTFIR